MKKAKKDVRGKDFPVVGLGASAGGLEALKAFFAKAPENSGMAYIVNVHLAPNQPSLMPELLQRVTGIPVAAARDGQVIEPDHVYTVPSDKILEFQGGVIRLGESGAKHPYLPIDNFLRSLAHDQGALAVAIILSGTGTDGTLGIKEIKVNDGLVLVQSPESAHYDGMPRSAISTGVVDMVLPPEEMVEKLVHYFTHAPLALELERKPVAAGNRQDWLHKIFALLRTRVGHDFSQYKANTLLRRISRRMGLNQISEQGDYLHYLRQHPEEVEALFRELLIGVTSFFRDPESFEALKTSILPEIFERMEEHATFRAWVPGCSTGEEVYSLAMVIREVLNLNPKQIKVQLFGTDIDTIAIDKAREGLFPANIASEVSAERLKRFFTMEGSMFRIRKEIRDCAVFSAQDLVRDPPFSRLHLLCCRNLLIYLDGVAQQKILPLFHYTLLPEGVLMLGSSESIGSFSDIFETLNKKWKIFRRREVPESMRRQISFPSGPATVEPQAGNGPAPVASGQKIDIGQMTQQALLEQFAPTAVLVDENGQLVYVQGRTGKYLETPSGVPTHNILDMARTGLRIEISSALRAAKSSGQPVLRRKIGIRSSDSTEMINLHVFPLQSPRELAGRFLVVFEDIEPLLSAESGQEEQGPRQESARITALEKELQITRESHQITIEELESSNEELKSTNEELQSANEELQSTNEELESSKEELQSLNEELQTVNSELQSKVEELSAAHDDMHNLLNGTEIATIFVDNEMRIRRFTPQAIAIVNLIQADVGRPLQHVVNNLSYEGMLNDLEEVLRTLSPKEHEVEASDNQWYKMRINPYRTTDNRIDGAVLTFVSINEQKQAQQKLLVSNREISQTWHLVRNVFDLTPDPLVVLDREGRIVIANTSFSELMQIAPAKAEGMGISESRSGILQNIGLEAKLRQAMADGEDFQLEPASTTLPAELGTWCIKGQVICMEEEMPRRIMLRFVREQ